MKRFGEKLLTLRQQQHLTIRQLGEALGMVNSYISQMETGQRTPSLKLAMKIAAYFAVDINCLINDELELP
jgi:putative transcriptional regulator